jgi:hypothetical protein
MTIKIILLMTLVGAIAAGSLFGDRANAKQTET